MTEEDDLIIHWSSGVAYYPESDEEGCLVPNISAQKPPPPPPPDFAFSEVQVIYFDVHGTLIDKEFGVAEALLPLLSQSPYQFDFYEAVSFYLESEYEVKKRIPEAPYTRILSETYEEVALRLGIESTSPDSALFAESIANWPLVPYVEWCLATLRAVPGLSISAIADMDHDSLLRTSAFATLAPYFNTVFTNDACAAYKPALAVFEGPVHHYEALGVQRENTCVVSASLLLDLEPARELGVPGIWTRYPQRLGEHVDPWESAYPAFGFLNLADLAQFFCDQRHQQSSARGFRLVG
ncbi:HAD-like domain-containing protein [Mycena sanguinolenta]|nr:HAD-like domain-containing protein [Mycena sanguinolenta]